MKSLLVLLWLCVAVGWSYPLHSSADSDMEFLQVRVEMASGLFGRAQFCSPQTGSDCLCKSGSAMEEC